MSRRGERYLDTVLDGPNGLDSSWDAEGRFRLQEAGLKLAESSRRAREIGDETGDALFRVQVELGLHELTAALSSLSRRLDTLEASTAAANKQDGVDAAVKSLGRTARCVSQALPGIASARTRRRALHGYFRESDDVQGAGAANLIDPATRALVVEGLACLAGKISQNATDRGRVDGFDGRAYGETRPSPRETTASGNGQSRRKDGGNARLSTAEVEEGGHPQRGYVLEAPRFPGERLDVKDLSALSVLSYPPSTTVEIADQGPRRSFSLRTKDAGHASQHGRDKGRKNDAKAGPSKRHSVPAPRDAAAQSTEDPARKYDGVGALNTLPSNHTNSALDAADTNPLESRTVSKSAAGCAGSNTEHLAIPLDRDLMQPSISDGEGTVFGPKEKEGRPDCADNVGLGLGEDGFGAEVARGKEEESTVKVLISPLALMPSSSSCPSSSDTPSNVDARRAAWPASRRQQPSGSSVVSGGDDLAEPSSDGVESICCMEATSAEKRDSERGAAGTKGPSLTKFAWSSENAGEGPGVNLEPAVGAHEAVVLGADRCRDDEGGGTGTRSRKYELEASLLGVSRCSAGGDALVRDGQGFLDLGALSAEDTPELGERLEPSEDHASVVANLAGKANALRRLEDRLKVYAAKPIRSIHGTPCAALDHALQHDDTAASNASTRPMACQYAFGASAAISMGPQLTAVADEDGDDVDSAPRPAEHQGMAPILSQLLAPPFDEDLRRQFVLSLTSHLAEYGGRETAGASRDDVSDVEVGLPASDEFDRAFLKAAVAKESALHASFVARGAGGGPQNADGDKANREQDGSLIDVVRRRSSATATVVAKEADELVNGSDRDGNTATVVPSPISSTPLHSATAAEAGEDKEGLEPASGVREDGTGQVGRDGSTRGNQRLRGSGKSAPSQSKEAGNAGWAQEYHEYLCTESNLRERGVVEDAGGQEREGRDARKSSKKGDEDARAASSDWAQEYHEYLCNKEKSREEAAAAAAGRTKA